MKYRSKGFSLVELMVVLSIVGIAATIGLPSFVPLVSKIRMDGEISALQSGLNLARSEAVKRGLPVVVCPSTNGTSCASGTNWSTGWMVLLNDGTGQVLQAQVTLARDALTSNSAASPAYPQFTSMGYTFFADTLTLHDPTNTASMRRCLRFASGTWTAITGATCP